MTDDPWRPWTKAQAEALRLMNAPVMAALDRQREAAESLATLAEQMAVMAEQIGQVARQHAEITRQMHAALQPYRDYLDWLDGKP